MESSKKLKGLPPNPRRRTFAQNWTHAVNLKPRLTSGKPGSSRVQSRIHCNKVLQNAAQNSLGYSIEEELQRLELATARNTKVRDTWVSVQLLLLGINSRSPFSQRENCHY